MLHHVGAVLSCGVQLAELQLRVQKLNRIGENLIRKEDGLHVMVILPLTDVLGTVPAADLHVQVRRIRAFVLG